MDFEDLYEGPRYEKRAKNRRFNKILNISIFVVFLGIIFFTYQLFFGDKHEPAHNEIGSESTIGDETSITDEDEDSEVESEEENSNEHVSDAVDGEEQPTSEQAETSTVKESTTNETTEQNEISNEISEDPNVVNIITNPTWEPIGTKQSEPHTANYDSTSQDWKEMIQTIEYATGLTEQNWILWRLGNGGSDQAAIGVVSSKDSKTVYRVFLEWKANKGWKPVKLEELGSVPEEFTKKNTTSDTDANSESEE
ncbi:YrrS family protein [Bacillus salitolerans]|uniref:YrrS family protein n=1 Tax=Bacillus salitolerans TaxID=1437434 RepID=A0ABW4LQB7_9BACI